MLTIVRDCTHANIGTLPPGMAAGYTTGTPDIRWTDADFSAHPGALRIVQDAGATDETADYADVETGAATPQDAANWVPRARAAWDAGYRPGQRRPGVYASADTIPAVTGALHAAGLHTGVGLIIANWDLDRAQAFTDDQGTIDGFPIVGIQFRSGKTWDTNVFNTDYLTDVSHKPPHSVLTDGTTPLGVLASSRGMATFPWVALQERLNPADAARLVGEAVPPKGLRWWQV